MPSKLEELQHKNNPHIEFVHETIRQIAALHPDHTALIDDSGKRITYGELVERAGRLARQLRGLGVQPDDRVAVLLDRSVELIVSMVAALEAGSAYVPIDTSYPDARIANVFQSLRPAVLISDREALGGIAAGCPVVHPNCDPAPESDATTPALKPEHLAYVVYTSGSTGVPKGVAMPHRGLSLLIEWQIAHSPAGLTTLHFTSVGFDVTFQEVFSTLCSGGTLALISDTVRRDPERLLATLEEHAIERLFLPYVALQNLAKAAKRLGVVPK